MKMLVIRSASMERFDALAAKLGLNSGFTGRVDVLTHPHAAPALRASYPSVTVIEYPFRGGFCRRAVARMIREGTLDADYPEVVALVGNIGGGGHFNVLRAADCFSGKRFIFNLRGELAEIPPDGIRRERVRRLCLFPLAVFGTILTLSLGVPVLVACLLFGTMAGSRK